MHTDFYLSCFSLQYHPDALEKSNNPAIYLEIKDAYEVLKDKKKRRDYDLKLTNELNARRTYREYHETTDQRHKKYSSSDVSFYFYVFSFFFNFCRTLISAVISSADSTNFIGIIVSLCVRRIEKEEEKDDTVVKRGWVRKFYKMLFLLNCILMLMNIITCGNDNNCFFRGYSTEYTEVFLLLRNC